MNPLPVISPAGITRTQAVAAEAEEVAAIPAPSTRGMESEPPSAVQANGVSN
jgi:hypothetical protein